MQGAILALAACANVAELPAELPHLARLVAAAAAEPEQLAAEMRAEMHATVMHDLGEWREEDGFTARNASVPVVLAHGMGDSCFNSGMKSVATAIGKKLGVYSTCKPTADSWLMDTIDGFLKNMDASVDEFAKRVKADPKLAGGFNALGLSQGNNLIRGYIQKYNDPPVHAFISTCGINAGVAAFPQCAPSAPGIGKVCLALNEVLGALAYSSLVQSILFQANYFRDPTRLNESAYQQHAQLAQWNGEGVNATLPLAKLNWARTKRFVWVRGTLDTVVWPNLGEQWGAVTDAYPANLSSVPMRQTRWYRDDAFGLRTADNVGKHAFEEFAGEHIRFTMAELDAWLDKYFV